MKETARHRKAFEQYFAMGENRSLRELAAKLGVARNTAKIWSRQLGWQERVAERDEAVAAVVGRQSVRAEVDRKTRNRQIVHAGIIAAAKAIAEGKMRPTLGDLDRLIRLEGFLEGEPDSRQELLARDLRNKTTDELRAMIVAEMRDLGRLVGVEEGRFELADGDWPDTGPKVGPN